MLQRLRPFWEFHKITFLNLSRLEPGPKTRKQFAGKMKLENLYISVIITKNTTTDASRFLGAFGSF